MEAANAEGKLLQHGFQYRNQRGFADLWGGAHHFPLRHFIHGVEVIQTLHSLAIALVHRVHPQIAWPALWIGLAPLSYGNLRGPGGLIGKMLLTIDAAGAQAV